MKPYRTRPGRGFTLVEMLVVVTIIGILAAILIPTIAAVQGNAKRTAITVEIGQLSSALDQYKQEHKDYPPDFTNVTAVANHVKSGYSRSRFKVAAWLTQAPANPPVKQDPTRLDPAEALVFWLSLLKRNVRNPFTGSGENQVYYEFKAEQLTDVDDDGWPEYTSKHTQGVPYVYFDGRVQNSANGGAGVCSYAWAVYPSPWSPLFPASNSGSLRLNRVGRNFTNYPIPAPAPGFEFGVARPYRSNTPITANSKPFNFPSPVSTPASQLNTTEWLEPAKFQILCTGLDGQFGIDNTDGELLWKQFPNPNYYSSSSTGDFTEDFDNITSFGEKTVGDSIP